MQEKKPYSLEKTNYYFTRVKDLHAENGQAFITLFARLTKEDGQETESVWVELDEVKWEQAAPKLKMMPNGIQTYLISEEIFEELLRLSSSHHKEMYFLTPLAKMNKFRKLG
ncbi:hypothetical protein [Planococcus lenghuensis]|uniref:Uncharacterized protein n=1 Tax=Planococcus lenghuensis TaxID=2213202 RepID=A0A1Q2L4B2_9BACL|nr:hypothetical protein [Planococcus lenghuensis]AQQ55263.1 hypothetical protein B0X71_18965 [Planococcus lenghuensis]